MKVAAQPYAKCQDCGIDLADRDAVTAHGRDTMAPTNELGVVARGHRVSIVNPTDEERRVSRVRVALGDALDRACEELWDDVERGYFTADEVKAEIWAFDLDIAWDEYVAGSEDATMSEPTIRPRYGDLEQATRPHTFQPSGEWVGFGLSRVEKCDLCGLVQRGTRMHPEWPATPKVGA